MQLRDQLRRTLRCNGPLDLRHVEREHKEEDKLRRIRFRRCNGDLWTCPCIDDLVCLTRNRGADHVCDGKRLCPAPLRLLERGERIARLPRLRNHNQESVLIDNRVAIAELGCNVNLDKDAGQLLDVVFADQPRMVCRTARDDVDLVECV